MTYWNNRPAITRHTRRMILMPVILFYLPFGILFVAVVSITLARRGEDWHLSTGLRLGLNQKESQSDSETH